MKCLFKYLKLYRIKKLNLILKLRISSMFHFLNHQLAHNGIKIITLRIKRPRAFNGVRARKLRRT